MIRYRICGLLLAVCFFWGCSSDDGAFSVTEQDALPDFQLIGEDGSNIYQYSYSSAVEDGSILNLTQANGVNRQYITLRQTGDLVSFFSFASDNFSVVFHDTGNNSSSSYPNFYMVADERAIIWGSNSESHIFLGFFSPRGSRNYSARILDPLSGSFTDVQIEDNTSQTFSPLYSNGRLALPYRDSLENYKIALLDTDNATIIQTLDFGASATSIFLNGIDELVILSSMDQLDYQYNFYDLQDATEVDQGSFEFNKYLPPGPLDANISNNKLYYRNFFAQPYPVTSGPAVFDLGIQEDLVIDILGIKLEVETEIGGPIILTDIHYLDNANSFAVGYAELANQKEWNGGVVFVRPDGEIINRIELPFVPTYVVRE